MTIATRRRRSARRAACIALALGAAAGLAGASYALVASRQGLPAPHARVLTFRAQPATRTVTRGATAVYSLRIGGYGRLVKPNGPRRPVRIWLSAAKAPRGISATFALRATRSTRSKLTVGTKSKTRPGRYRLRLRARGHLGRPGHRRMRLAWTTVTLVVVAPQRAFAITGRLTELLAPGRAVPLDLRLTNSRNYALTIRRLAVSVDFVNAPQANASHPCTLRDFAVLQLSGSYGLRLGARRSRNLSAFAIPRARWPRVAMIDRPVNQDGCKRASLGLSFAGIATRG